MAHIPFHHRLAHATSAALLLCAGALVHAQAPQPQRTADAVVPPAQPAQAGAPVFDMEAARGTVRSLVRKGELGDGGLPRDPAPNRPGMLSTRADYQLARGIDQARRADCKTAYAGAGIFAIIPLLYDTIMDTGCRW